jgi:hypothetical protein
MFRSWTVATALLLGAPAWGCNPATVQPDVDGGVDPQEDGGGGGGTDGGLPGDDGGGQAGLGITFGSIPSLPGAISGTSAFLDDAEIHLEDVRAVGDSAPGDSRTTEPRLELHWGGGGGGDDGGGDDGGGGDDLLPGGDDDISVFFATAPPGKYSDVKADVISYRLRGSVDVGGTEYEFRIEDDLPIPRSMNIALGEFPLEANTTRTISIKADLGPAISAVDWASLAGGGGEIRLDGSYAQIEAVRQSLAGGFVADTSGSP